MPVSHQLYALLRYCACVNLNVVCNSFVCNTMLPQDYTGRIHRDTFIVSIHFCRTELHLIVYLDLNISIAGTMSASHCYPLHHTLSHAEAALLRR